MPEPMTITEAAEFIRKGALSPTELLEQCLARIDRYEDRVRAWVIVDRDGAREQAARLTAELKQNNYRGPLHGIPLGIKDIIDVFDLPTGCGSKRWANSYARRDATCVERLRQAGAVIMGKTVTTAYASFDPPVTRNPWNLDRTPGGSSSGSAAAVACGMCLGALASQTGGSITRPASYCGVYSLKPTHGRVSVDGVLPLAPSMDHVGVMANCVRDLAILFRVIAGEGADAEDCFREIDLTVSPDNKYPPVVKWLRGMFDSLAEPAMREAMETLFRKPVAGRGEYGAVIEDFAPPPGFSNVLARHRIIMSVEAAEYHEQRLRRHPEDYPPRIRSLIEEGLRCPAIEYRRAVEERHDLANVLNASFRGAIMLTPASTGPAPDVSTTGDPAFNSPWSYTGLPTVSVPFAWTAEGLPMSIQLTGWRGGESRLLAEVAWLEAAISFTRRPLPL
jgi:Asp-tRNA(Asn)/Glu-tRNA(Gln) amidotransferase A subunit family amidase